jgi:hypothetical protein
VKAKVKSAVSFVDRYEDLLQDLALSRKCHGIICGHIHTPADKQVGSIHYLNSGDWVESLTAIIEHHDGRMELVRHQEFLATLGSGGGIEPNELLGRRKTETRSAPSSTSRLERSQQTLGSGELDLVHIEG